MLCRPGIEKLIKSLNLKKNAKLIILNVVTKIKYSFVCRDHCYEKTELWIDEIYGKVAKPFFDSWDEIVRMRSKEFDTRVKNLARR